MNIHHLFHLVDQQQTEAYLEYFHDDGIMTFGNQPPAVGHEEIRRQVDGLFQSVKKLHHEIDHVWKPEEDTVIVNGQVTYTKHSGEEVPVVFSGTYFLKDEKISNYQVFIDVSPLSA
ncbi:nuclear transport factor 2 family protein [Alkalicoccus urumqiensis]|uniref:SnoaL-like domain-containing protein n=1 Tax=Alkalicoccus urumqiensis TaxID=1548213 RepID=A0A2P6ME40_ALKUR|nr:nuclear transport factor 2 family protein [Alkalicoccus urumqiensis]PRO64535.1 hypothetical protein C6I21_14540 [Alkalicoccus urumqiensis]